MDEGLGEYEREDPAGYAELLNLGSAGGRGRKGNTTGAEVFKDDLTGQVLDSKIVMDARRKELDYFGMKGVWVKRKVGEATQRTGKRTITVRWVDVN